MTDTEPSTRPIAAHERWTLGDPDEKGYRSVVADGAYMGSLKGFRADTLSDLLAAAGKVHAVLVDLPDVAGGGQLVTWSYPNGVVEASWRQSARDTWVPVELLDGGSVVVAP